MLALITALPIITITAQPISALKLISVETITNEPSDKGSVTCTRPSKWIDLYPDLILTNGKIVTVDDKFSIAQAAAVKGN